MENKQSRESSCTRAWLACMSTWFCSCKRTRGHRLTSLPWGGDGELPKPSGLVQASTQQHQSAASLCPLAPMLAGNNPVLPASQQWCQVWLVLWSEQWVGLLPWFWLWMSKAYSLFPLLSPLPLLVLFIRLDTPFLHLSLLPKVHLWYPSVPALQQPAKSGFWYSWCRHAHLYMQLRLERLRCCAFCKAVLPKSPQCSPPFCEFQPLLM